MENRIFIFGHYGEKNTGDDAMIYALLQELYNIYPNANFSIMSPREIFVPHQTVNKIKIVKPSIIPVFREIMRSSVFIMGGGTQIYDFGRRSERFKILSQMFLILIWAKIFCEKIYFLNIGIEPFKTTILKYLAKQICQLADFISVRDKNSYNILKNMGIHEVKNSFDLAVLLNYQNSSNNKNNILGLSVLPFYEIYHNRRDLDNLMIGEIANKIDNWLQRDSRNKLHLFVFKGKSRADDYEISHMLKNKIKNVKQVKIIHYNPNPLKTISEVSKCTIFIGMRYHSCLFAYITKTPLLIIAYFQKCNSLAEEIKLPQKAIISIDNISNGRFEEYLNNMQHNPDDYTADLPIELAKKKATIFTEYLKE